MFISVELERQFKDSRCSTVLTDEGNLEKVRKAVKGAPNVKVRKKKKENRVDLLKKWNNS